MVAATITVMITVMITVAVTAVTATIAVTMAVAVVVAESERAREISTRYTGFTAVELLTQAAAKYDTYVALSHWCYIDTG